MYLHTLDELRHRFVCINEELFSKISHRSCGLSGTKAWCPTQGDAQTSVCHCRWAGRSCEEVGRVRCGCKWCQRDWSDRHQVGLRILLLLLLVYTYVYKYQTKLGMTKVGLIGSWGCHVTPMRIQCIGQICLPNTSILVVKSLWRWDVVGGFLENSLPN